MDSPVAVSTTLVMKKGTHKVTFDMRNVDASKAPFIVGAIKQVDSYPVNKKGQFCHFGFFKTMAPEQNRHPIPTYDKKFPPFIGFRASNASTIELWLEFEGESHGKLECRINGEKRWSEFAFPFQKERIILHYPTQVASGGWCWCLYGHKDGYFDPQLVTVWMNEELDSNSCGGSSNLKTQPDDVFLPLKKCKHDEACNRKRNRHMTILLTKPPTVRSIPTRSI